VSAAHNTLNLSTKTMSEGLLHWFLSAVLRSADCKEDLITPPFACVPMNLWHLHI